MRTCLIDGCTVAIMPLVDASTQRQREKLTVARLLHALNLPTTVDHHADGSPYINGYQGQVSISHSHRSATVALCPDGRRPGIDTETWRPQLERVRHKFLSPTELVIYDTPAMLLMAWCMKEAAYKAAGIPGLHITDDIILPTTPSGDTIIIAPTGMQLKVYAIESADTHATVFCLPR